MVSRDYNGILEITMVCLESDKIRKILTVARY